VGNTAAAAAAANSSSTPNITNNASAQADAGHTMQQQQQPSSDAWHLSRLPNSAAQQQQWGAAAFRALELFSLHDLLGASSSSSSSEGLDHTAWQQALLLQPQLLDQLLEAAAAAVLQPLVPAGQLAGKQLDGLQHQQTSCTMDGDMRQQTAGASSSSSSSSSIVALLTSSKLPWQQLPSTLAASPLLMLKVGWYSNCSVIHFCISAGAEIGGKCCSLGATLQLYI
jgi:hypothetical protein